MVVDTIGCKTSHVLLKVILDPGSTKMMISSKALPKNVILKTFANAKSVTTLTGTMKQKAKVHLHNFRLSEC